MDKGSPQAIVLMGVSGCGKTSVGERLSQILGWPFFDGDDFHPTGNVAKMSQGIPLNDDDRAPWLAILHDLIADHLQAGKSMILACSALKQKYRDQLEEGNPEVLMIYLKGDFNLIFERMSTREDHYMKAEMLRSQFEALEEPADAITVNIDKNLEEIVEEIGIYVPSGRPV
jgi:gluconokinase